MPNLLVLVAFLKIATTQDIKFSPSIATIPNLVKTKAVIPGCRFTSTGNISNDNLLWFKNGTAFQTHVTASPIVETNIFSFSNIVLKSTSFQDEGVYQCGIKVNDTSIILSDGIQLVVREIDVRITSVPVALKRKDKGSITSLSGCVFTSSVSLKGHAYWLVNNDDERKKSIDISLLNSTHYVLSSIVFFEDGFYQCRVFDPERMKTPVDSKNATTINMEANIGNPTVSVLPIYAGDALDLIGCVYNHTPGVNLQSYWLVNGVNTSYASNTHGSQFQIRSLKIPVTSLNDRGRYQCAIYSKQWMKKPMLSDVINVDFKAITVIITRHPKVLTANKANTVYVTGCSYTSTRRLTKPSYWLLNGKPLEQSIKTVDELVQNEYVMPSLRINSYNMSGIFQCVIFDSDLMSKEEISDATVEVVLEEPHIQTNISTVKIPTRNNESLFIEGFTIFSSIPHDNLQAYWLKNGVHKIKSELFALPQQNLFKLSPINESAFSYDNQGFYQAVVEISGYPRNITSQIIDVQLKDVSHTVVTLLIDDTFNNVNSSAEKRRIENKIKLLLPKADKHEDVVVSVTQLSPTQQDKVELVCRILYTNISPVKRLILCDAFGDKINVGTLKEIKVTTVELQSLDCCPSSNNDVLYENNKTLVGTFALFKCKHNLTNTIYRTCMPSLQFGPRWSDVDMSKCLSARAVSQELQDLQNVKICGAKNETNCLSAAEVSKNLTRTVTNSDSKRVNSKEVSAIGDVISNIVTELQTLNASSQKEVLNDIVNIADSLIDVEPRTLVQSQRNHNTSTSILNSLDILAETISDISNASNIAINISTKNVGFSVVKSTRTNITIQSRERNGTMDVVIGDTTQKLGKLLVTIAIPEEAFKEEEGMVYSYSFKKNSFFLREKKNNKLIVQSVILSASIRNTKVDNLITPVELKFKKIKLPSHDGNHSCQFWDFNKGTAGDWSSVGCRLVSKDRIYITCLCDHLTNFALLLDVGQSGYNPVELQIITWIGCGLSLAGLMLTVMIYMFFRELRKKLPPRILICLCISMMALLTTFLIGAERTSSRVGCQVVAALLQYFMLTTFCWMFVEGINLYRCFVKVFVDASKKKFIYKASLFAWGLPVMVVVVTVGIEPNNLGNDRICIIHGYSFYFGVLLPICLILLVNTGLLICVIFKLSYGKAGQGKPGKTKIALLGQAKVALMCIILVGVAWAFGVVAVGKATPFFQWLFCIFNSFQGFCIFVFYTIKNTAARREIRKFINIKILRPWSKACQGPKDRDRSRTITSTRVTS
ncbi:uncharacterized protein LOC130623866 [Hydractinia symbiolongicarpus]|uniref:uncharacterized protein LOC130623866 n=1 Tax=Hydractinia symbiolongicarpus TaxID=13093 RepID=UPI00254B80D8|nr:uncharacterized protein LOC130623866 [Hydractinia symbiolongicarpus]